jgi:hypothetical protein
MWWRGDLASSCPGLRCQESSLNNRLLISLSIDGSRNGVPNDKVAPSGNGAVVCFLVDLPGSYVARLVAISNQLIVVTVVNGKPVFEASAL